MSSDRKKSPVIVAKAPPGDFSRVGAETVAEALKILQSGPGPRVWTCFLQDAQQLEASLPAGQYEFRRHLKIEKPRPGRAVTVTSCDLYMIPIEPPRPPAPVRPSRAEEIRFDIGSDASPA